MLDQWAYHNGVEIDFSRPGKPTDNAFCEAFNGRVRAECLNASWFVSMADAGGGQTRPGITDMGDRAGETGQAKLEKDPENLQW